MNENEQENKKVNNSNLDIKLWAVGSVLFILMSIFGYFAYLQSNFPLFSRGDYATLGDSFGILSSLFSGLAFAGLIVTIVMQNKTLKAQMEELELARKEYKRQGDELAGQKEVMNAQFQSIQLQQFETTFFKLIDRHNSIIKNSTMKHKSDIGGSLKEVKGYEYIELFFSKSVNYEKNTRFYSRFSREYHEDFNLFLRKYFYSLKQVMDLFSFELKMLSEINRLNFYMSLMKSGMSESELRLIYFIIYFFRNEIGSVEKAKDFGFFDGVMLFDFSSMELDSQEEFLNAKIFILKMLEYYGCEVVKKDSNLLEWLEENISYCESRINGNFFDELAKEIKRLNDEVEKIDSHSRKLFTDMKWEEKINFDKSFVDYQLIDFDHLSDDINVCAKLFNSVKNMIVRKKTQIETNMSNLHLFEDCLSRSKQVQKSYIDPARILI